MNFDYQSVKLVAVTQPTIEKRNDIDFSSEGRNLTADEFIAYTARVSNPANQMNMETAPKLISYLIKNQHWSPFEMVSATLEIKTTRDIGRQILRHRSFAFQEFSQRYAKATEILHGREARLQDKKNRQNSVELGQEDSDLELQWHLKQVDIKEAAECAYGWALENGIAKEQARAILPEGLTMSTMYMAGSLRSWLHYITLRSANGTQKEHQDIALKAKDEILKAFPSCSDYLNS